MSKRRLDEDEARRAGLKAWETPEGRRWLLKALNPNDTALPTTGIPTLKCRNISVLNWQGEYSINAPENITSTVPSYDSTLFLYQHPLIFGLSAARPSGCDDMSTPDRFFRIQREATATANLYTYTITPGEPLDRPISKTRCERYLNGQIDPSVFKDDDSLAGRRILFRTLTQKNRMIYGGATIIPTCSNQFNSGSLAVSQQIFSARRTVLKEDNNVGLESFTKEDFPNTSDTVQNPQMYYGRYQDGAYIPYKMNEPAAMPYVGSEQQITTRSPYYVTEVSFIGYQDAPAEGSHNIQLVQVNAEWTAVNDRNFKISSATPLRACTAIRFNITFKTGQQGYYTIGLADSVGGASKVIYTDEMYTAAEVKTSTNATGANVNLTYANACVEGTTEDDRIAQVLDLTSLYIRMPAEITAWQSNNTTLELANSYGSYYKSDDIATEVNRPAEYKIGTICPYNGQSIIAVHMAGVSNTAPIKMIIRYGIEILLVSSSPYSPFKFMSPRYDESAIKSYARCIRAMKDAYFANAGSVPGQLDYTNKLMTLIENDSAEDLNRTLNQGGSWYGVVQ